jgi:hypothetical protein
MQNVKTCAHVTISGVNYSVFLPVTLSLRVNHGGDYASNDVMLSLSRYKKGKTIPIAGRGGP